MPKAIRKSTISKTHSQRLVNSKIRNLVSLVKFDEQNLPNHIDVDPPPSPIVDIEENAHYYSDSSEELFELSSYEEEVTFKDTLINWALKSNLSHNYLTEL